MSFVDNSMHSLFTIAGYKTLANEFADGLRSLSDIAHGVPHEDDAEESFSPRRMKSERLPAIDSCQSSIFRELRQREEVASYTKTAAEAPRGAKLFGIKDRLNQMLSGPKEVLH